jgi:hypothetical protein
MYVRRTPSKTDTNTKSSKQKKTTPTTTPPQKSSTGKNKKRSSKRKNSPEILSTPETIRTAIELQRNTSVQIHEAKGKGKNLAKDFNAATPDKIAQTPQPRGYNKNSK